MKRFTLPATCSICGGPAELGPQDFGANWITGVSIEHVDPNTCREYLRATRKKIEAEKTRASEGAQKGEH